jgi:N-acetylglucosamine kinase-like BadF-type ATPase
MASLAKQVGEAADAGDEIARTILSQAGEILAKTAIVAARRLKGSHQTVDVYYGGGVFNAGCWILESFADAIHQGAPNARVCPPRFPPVAGTIFLALHPFDIPLSEDFLRHLAKGLKEIGWM